MPLALWLRKRVQGTTTQNVPGQSVIKVGAFSEFFGYYSKTVPIPQFTGCVTQSNRVFKLGLFDNCMIPEGFALEINVLEICHLTGTLFGIRH